MTDFRSLSVATFGLAGGLATVALLGPLAFGVIDYRYSQSMLNQATGLDAFVLLVVVPVTVAAGVLVRRRPSAGALLALPPAGFGLYMLSQYVIGPEYLRVDGNGERFFLLFVALFVLSGVVMAQAWRLAVAPVFTDAVGRRRGALLLVLAAFVVVGMYLSNGFVSAMADFPEFVADRAAESEYEEHPTAYWLVALLDLAVVVPLTVATGLGLRHGAAWAGKAFYAVIGWYALVPGSVAAMAVVMVLRDDPAAHAGRAAVFVTAAALFLFLGARTFRALTPRRGRPLPAALRELGLPRRAVRSQMLAKRSASRRPSHGRGRASLP
jgi:hypothetical protein